MRPRRWSFARTPRRTYLRRAFGRAGRVLESQTCCRLRSSRTTHLQRSLRLGMTGASCRSVARIWMLGCSRRRRTWGRRTLSWIGRCGLTLLTGLSDRGRGKMLSEGGDRLGGRGWRRCVKGPLRSSASSNLNVSSAVRTCHSAELSHKTTKVHGATQVTGSSYGMRTDAPDPDRPSDCRTACSRNS